MKDYVVRVHLKTDTEDRSGLIKYCLENAAGQYLAIGWNSVYGSGEFNSYEEYYEAVIEGNHKEGKRLNPALNIFREADKGDLFWTRDEKGFYWICSAQGKAKPQCDTTLDIGAVIPVKAYKLGLEVPGQIKASFNRPRGGTAQRIYGKKICEYSKYVYNTLSGRKEYEVHAIDGNIIDNLPDFDLEELVISYIQIKYNYYVLSNSIASNSTTPLIECEFRSRDRNNVKKAVVQVKGGERVLSVSDFKDYLDNGFEVFLYAYKYEEDMNAKNVIFISREELTNFYREYKSVLPESITKWENLFSQKL